VKSLSLWKTPASALIPQRMAPEAPGLNLDSPATTAMTNFERECPVTISPERRIDDALQDMTHAPQTARQRITAYLFTALALVTCPCHLPIWIALLAGTTAGAYLSEHWGIAALALTGLFVLSLTRPSVQVRPTTQEKRI